MKERHDSYCTGLAAEHLIMSCLTRLGLEVYLTMGNRKKTDIRVIDPVSLKASSVDVKAVKGYSSLIVNNVKASSDHFIVFVVFNERLSDPSYMPDIFVVPSLEVESITSHYKEEKRVMKSKLDIYKNRWDYLKSNEENKTSTETFWQISYWRFLWGESIIPGTYSINTVQKQIKFHEY